MVDFENDSAPPPLQVRDVRDIARNTIPDQKPPELNTVKIDELKPLTVEIGWIEAIIAMVKFRIINLLRANLDGEPAMQSKIFSLNLPDWAKAIIMAFLGSFIGALMAAFDAGTLWAWVTLQGALKLGFGAALAYLTKNFLTNNQGEFLRGEPKKSSTGD